MSLNSEIYTLKSFDTEIVPGYGGDKYRIYLPVGMENYKSQEQRYAIRDDEAASFTGATPVSSFERNMSMSSQRIEEIREKIDYARDRKDVSVRIANAENPIRAPSGGAVDLLDDDYLVLIRKDGDSPRDPLHFASGTGYPQNIEEIFDPRKVISREASEEMVYVRENNGSKSFLLPSDRRGHEENMYPRMMYSQEISSEVLEVEYGEGNDRIEIHVPPNAAPEGSSGGAITKLDGTFSWEPERAGANIIKLRKPGISSDEIVEGSLNIYDGEGDIDGWNRSIYLVPRNELAEALHGNGRRRVDVYRSEMEDSGREFRRDRIEVGDNASRNNVDPGGLRERNLFVPTKPLRDLLVDKGIFPGPRN